MNSVRNIRFSKISKFFLMVVLISGWIFSGWPQVWNFPPTIQKARAAVAFQGVSAIAASTGADVTVILPSHEANDIFLLQIVVRDVDDTITVADWTQITTITDGTAAKHWWFWKRATSASETDPLVDKNTTTGDTYASVTSYRGAITSGDPWEAKGTAVCTGTTNPFNLTGIDTLTANSLVVATWNDIDNFLSSVTYTPTNPSSLTSDMVNQSAIGYDGTNASASAVRTDFGATGNVSVNPNKAPDAACGLVLALKLHVDVYSIAITPVGTISYGFVPLNTASSTVSTSYTKTATNDGNTTEKINVKSSNATNGTQWTLGSASGDNIFKHEFSTTTGSVWTVMPDDTTYVMADPSVAVSGTVTFDFQLTTPDPSSDYLEKSITITVQAVAP